MTITGGPARAAAPAHSVRDSTRTIAVVALVLSGVALLGQVLSALVPLLFVGVLGLVAPGFEDGGGMVPESGTSLGMTVPGPVGRPVSSDELEALVAMAAPPVAAVRCEDVPEVRSGALGVCRGLDGPATYVVVELDGAGHADVSWWSAGPLFGLGPGY